MKFLKLILSVIGLLALTACGGGGGSSASSGGTTTTVAGVSTAPQISVVTAK